MAASLSNLIDPITLGLMVAAMLGLALLQNGAASVAQAIAALAPLFTSRPEQDRDAARSAMLQVDQLAQIRGLGCTDRVAAARQLHPFVAEAVARLANSDRAEQFDMWAEQALADRAQRHAAVHGVWNSMADAAPALGMAGTIMGLVGMFAAMNDPAAIGPSMALALLTTLYGVVLANLVAAPVASRLASLSAREIGWQRELTQRMLSVARRENAPLRRASMREVA